MTDPKKPETEAEMVERRAREEATLREEHAIEHKAALALPRRTPVEEQMRANAISKTHQNYKRDVRKMVDRHQTEEGHLRTRLHAASLAADVPVEASPEA